MLGRGRDRAKGGSRIKGGETHKGQSIVKRGQGLGMSGDPVMGLATN